MVPTVSLSDSTAGPQPVVLPPASPFQPHPSLLPPVVAPLYTTSQPVSSSSESNVSLLQSELTGQSFFSLVQHSQSHFIQQPLHLNHQPPNLNPQPLHLIQQPPNLFQQPTCQPQPAYDEDWGDFQSFPSSQPPYPPTGGGQSRPSLAASQLLMSGPPSGSDSHYILNGAVQPPGSSTFASAVQPTSPILRFSTVPGT